MLLLWTALAFGDDACNSVSLTDILAVPEPAIIVLGERRGAQPDLARAMRVVKGLQKKSGFVIQDPCSKTYEGFLRSSDINMVLILLGTVPNSCPRLSRRTFQRHCRKEVHWN